MPFSTYDVLLRILNETVSLQSSQPSCFRTTGLENEAMRRSWVFMLMIVHSYEACSLSDNENPPTPL